MLKKSESDILRDVSRWGYIFVIACIIGWIFETAAVWIYDGQFSPRGVFFLSEVNGFVIPWGFPAITIYGVGGLMLYAVYQAREKWEWLKNPIVLYLVSAVMFTALELLASYLLEWIWGRKYWYYAGGWLNFQGRVNLNVALTWGLFGLVGATFLMPWMEKMLEKYITKKWQYWTILIIIAYILVCMFLRERLFPGVYSYDVSG